MISFTKAEAIVEAYQRVRLTGQTHINENATIVKEKWHLSPRNAFKINVDVAIDNKKTSKIRAVIRDSNIKIITVVFKTSQM